MPEIGNGSVFFEADASNNTATMPGWNGSALPSTIDDAGRALQGAIKREWAWRNPTITSGGSANAQTLTYGTAPAAYYNGQSWSFVAGATNTGSCTLNINSLGATTIKKLFNGTASNLVGGEITSGNVVTVVYNSAGSCFYLEYNDKIWSKGTDVASASTVTFGEAGYYDITGTTTITALALSTDRAGKVVTVQFDGALTLTHNATSLILPGGVNITTAAGDRAAFISEGSGNFRCLWYTPAASARVTSTTGTAPYYAARAWVKFDGTGTVSITASQNVTSITDNGTGEYTVNFTTAMADANYATVGACRRNAAGTRGTHFEVDPDTAPTSSAVKVRTIKVDTSPGVDDSDEVYVAIFR